MNESAQKSRRIVMVVFEAGHFAELFRLARCLKDAGDFRPVFFFVWRYESMRRDAGECLTEGFEHYSPDLRQIGPDESKQKESICFQAAADAHAAKKFLKRFARFAPATVDLLLADLKKCVEEFQQILRAGRAVGFLRPDAMIFAEDNPEYASAALIKAGHQRRIASVIFPYTMATAAEPAEALAGRYEYSLVRTLNRLVGRLRPKWVRRHKDQSILRLSPLHVLAKEILRLSPADPWQVNSGQADAIAVESPALLEYWRKAGLPADRLFAVGLACDEIMAEAIRDADHRRADLLGELDLSADKKLIVCALPPDQFAAGRRPAEFAGHPEMVRSLLLELSEITGHVTVVRPHPRTPDSITQEMQLPNVRFTRRDIIELIPLCHIYVAGASATVRWAIACGRPVVNYDVYGYHYADFADAGGVVTVERKEDFSRTIHKMANDDNYYNELSARQRNCMKDWGMLDGNFLQRFRQLLDSLMCNWAKGN